MAEEEAKKVMGKEAVDLASLDFTKKKKKKKAVIQDPVAELTEKTSEQQIADHVEEEEAKEAEDSVLQQDPDRDYTYEEMLKRSFAALSENNPELAGKTVMRPPQILREGTNKTVFADFMDQCKSMHRQPEHVMDFLLAEMGTTGSVDGQQRVVVKGRFAQKNFEAILRRYMIEYVLCNACKSSDSILTKENRLFFVRCEKCGASRSVEPIKRGYVAQVGGHKKAAA